jgi:hypothetical protein
MQKDFVETTNDNPIVHLLEKHNALELINEETSSLYPQVWGLCEFERRGFRYVGEYESPVRPINIKYEIYQTPKYEDVLTCEARAPLKYWTYWREQFPPDFIEALQRNATSGVIFPYKEIKLFQQLTFKETGIERLRVLRAHIYKGFETIPVTKINHSPTIVGTIGV